MNSWDDQKAVSTESVFASVLSVQPVIAGPSSCGTISDVTSAARENILLGNAGQRNVSAKASQADEPETANVLSITAMTALGIALLPGDAFAQPAADIEGVKAASKAFYAALAVLDKGEAMAKVWAHTPYITNLGPRGKSITVGWDANSKYWGPANEPFASRNASLSEPHIHANGNLAWEMGNEIGESKLKDGTVRKIDNFATNVYEKIDGRWLMVSHHAQPKPQ